MGLTTLASAYTDNGILPMLSFTRTVASVRLPDGRTLPLFNELGGFSRARAASRDGHLLGGGGGSPFPTEDYRHAILIPETVAHSVDHPGQTRAPQGSRHGA